MGRLDKLRNLTDMGLIKPASQLQPKADDGKERCPVEEAVEGTFIETGKGPLFCSEHRYPLSKPLANAPADYFRSLSIPRFEQIAGFFESSGTAAGIDRSKLLFFDTETTGLSGGAGTIIFMAGVGFFEDDDFVVQQYFIRDYNEEPALLDRLSELINLNQALVTFNGKSFDVPLLKTRYVMRGIHFPGDDMLHFDLLHPARRFWKRLLDSCSLQSLERDILKVRRSGADIPGSEIPDMYFAYLQTGDARPIARIFYHNRIDVTSMLALFNVMLLAVNSEIEDENTAIAVDYEFMGRIFESKGEAETAVRLYSKAAETGSDELSLKAQRRLSLLYKRNQDWSQAVSVWEQMIAAVKKASVMDSFPFEELAKYYEHHAKDLVSAGQIVEEGIRYCERSAMLHGGDYRSETELFTYRLQRIKRKQNKAGD